MTKEDILLNKIKPELLNALKNYPSFGSIGFKITLQNDQPVKIDSSKTVTLKV